MNAVHRAGMAAKGYSYNGYAYKCFSEGYPKEEIECEYNLQQEVVKSGLPIPNYYRSEFPNSIKMDLIRGTSMLDRLMADESGAVIPEMMGWFEKIHAVKGLRLPDLSEYLLKKIDEAPASKEQKALARQYYAEVDSEVHEPESLCHMDYHFLNVMCEGDDVRIIDWTNAKNGKAIWDYARTCFICSEHAAELKAGCVRQILARIRYPRDTFMKAVYVSAICRLTEHDTKRVRTLIDTGLFG